MMMSPEFGVRISDVASVLYGLLHDGSMKHLAVLCINLM